MSTSLLSRRDVINGVAATAVLTAAQPVLPASEDSLNFLVVGDWGRDGTDHQRDVAVQMGKTAANLRSRFVISVGDNFYENGVQSLNDPQWRSSFEEIYSARSLQQPWYVALGNHDYRGVPQAQVDYTKTSHRWRMPSRYYKVLGRDLDAPHMDLFFIDTSPLVHQYWEQVESVIAANVRRQDVGGQLRWLDEQLTQSTADWKLVVGHHPVHSGGSAHGDTPELVAQIEPLLQKHGGRAYINGHDHDLQHIRQGGVDYIGCGAGSEVRPVNPVKGTQFCVSRSGFAALSLERDALAVEFRDFTGASLYRAHIPGTTLRTSNAEAA